MRTKATILVPTHDHGEMLKYSVGSDLNQTIENFEIFIVGDGVPDITRVVVDMLVEQDDRDRFFDNPKGPRHGEIHRHSALKRAQSEIICYLADDDLDLPDLLGPGRRLSLEQVPVLGQMVLSRS